MGLQAICMRMGIVALFIVEGIGGKLVFIFGGVIFKMWGCILQVRSNVLNIDGF